MGQIHSMTGFGHGEAGADWAISCDVRSVNNRHCDIHARLPSNLQAMEPHVIKLVRQYVGRGRVDLTIRYTALGAGSHQLTVDTELADQYREAIAQLAASSSSKTALEPTALELVRLDGVLHLESVTRVDEVQEPLLQAVEEALQAHQTSRVVEGKALADDMARRLAHIARELDEVETGANELLPKIRDRLEIRIQGLVGDVPVDPERVLAEAAVLAERADIHEEIVRMREHLRAFHETLQAGGRVGRKLDFLAQEMLRESNTMGSKSAVAALSHRVIDIRSEVERIREQVQNIE